MISNPPSVRRSAQLVRSFRPPVRSVCPPVRRSAAHPVTTAGKSGTPLAIAGAEEKIPQ